MPFIKHVSLFIKKLYTQLRRKWLSLPLLLLFPLLMLGLIFIIVITFIMPKEQDPIQIGLIDLDQSQETTLILELISESTELGDFIEIHKLTDSEATEMMDEDQLHVSLTFPENFTAQLYEGESINIEVTGNKNYPTESYLVNEIITSITRLISAAQANILTINHYAKLLNLDYETRNDMLFEQFKEFLVYTLSKDKIIEHEDLVNHATSSPLYYYGLAAWFIIVMIWVLIFYNYLYTQNTARIKQRMKLYGVTDLQEQVARIIVTGVIVAFLATASFIALSYFLNFDLILEDYLRIGSITFLHSLIFILLLAIIETIIKSQKIKLLVQSLGTFLLILMSGATIPTIYFPMKVQIVVPYLFSNHAFYWIQEVILNDRYYADFIPLLLNSLIAICTLIGLSLWKERLNS